MENDFGMGRSFTYAEESFTVLLVMPADFQ